MGLAVRSFGYEVSGHISAIFVTNTEYCARALHVGGNVSGGGTIPCGLSVLSHWPATENPARAARGRAT